MISCILPTKNRRRFLPEAFKCWQEQTISNTELIVVWEGDDIRDLIPDDSRIHLVKNASGITLGNKRNLGACFAVGEYIAHFDDDDYYAPDRLNEQLTILQFNNKAVTAFHREIFTDGNDRWDIDWSIGNPPNTTCFGNSLFYKRVWWNIHPFLNIQYHEDTMFIREAVKFNNLITSDGFLFVISRNHEDNTWPRDGICNYDSIEKKCKFDIATTKMMQSGRMFSR